MRLVLHRLAFGCATAVAGLLAASACADQDTSGDQPEAVTTDAAADGTAFVDAPADADGGVPACSKDGICVVAAPIDARFNITTICGTAADDVWAAGSGGLVLHYDGAAWERADLDADDAAVPFTMVGLVPRSRTDVWLVAGNAVLHSGGWKGAAATSWTRTYRDPELPVPTALQGAGDLFWTAHQNNFGDTPTLGIHRAAPGGRLVGSMASDSLGFALYALHASTTDVWAVGDEGRVVHATRAIVDGGADAGAADDPQSWMIRDLNSQTRRALQAVHVVGDTVWLAGEGGILRRLRRPWTANGNFESVPSPTTETLRGIFGIRPDDVWAVGDHATVLHFDGTAWRSLATPFDPLADKPNLRAVWSSGQGKTWFGGFGIVLEQRGEQP